MRIALVILHADPARGGAERYTVDLADQLRRRGHDVNLLASSFADEIELAGRVVLPAPGATRRGRYEGFLDSLDAHLSTNQYDVVHAMLPVRRCDVYHPHAGMAAEQLGRWSTAFNPRRRAMADVEKNLLHGNAPPVVLALSDYVKSAITRFYQLPEKRLLRLFNGVDLAKFVPTIRDASERIEALIIAQDFERKGLRFAIEAMARVNDARLRLTVVGRDRPGEYQKLAARLKANVHFAGPTTDPAGCYRQADFFILPTKHDPCSLVVLEALAMGLPVISTRFNGACEVMTDGTHGFVLDRPDDVGGLCQSVNRLLDADVRTRMSESCLSLRAELSLDHHIDRLLGIYAHLR